uniref:Protein-tyrosine phosphatase n=1 Tax=Musca domestica TaxID=7370 RepID=A0A1I8N2X5_MUSDO
MASNALLRLRSQQQQLVSSTSGHGSNESSTSHNELDTLKTFSKLYPSKKQQQKQSIIQQQQHHHTIKLRPQLGKLAKNHLQGISRQHHLRRQHLITPTTTTKTTTATTSLKIWKWRSPSLRFGGLDSIAIWLQVLLFIVYGLNDVANGEGNVGCKFVRTLCLEGSEVCFDDNIFGKCIPTTGVDMEDIEKTPLTEDQSRLLATMLEELQGAGLGWDHPYVQCRIQGSLFSMQKQIQLPPNLCANLAPMPTDFEPADAMAFVRFIPPEEDYPNANKLFYPPLKKHNSPGPNGINAILHQLQLQDRQVRNDPLELSQFGEFDRHRESQMNPPNVMDVFLENERARIQREQEQREAQLEAERKEAARNRLELYQMLAASEPDPQPYERNPERIADQMETVPMPPSVPIYVPEEPSDDSNEFYFPENYGPLKRTSPRKGAMAPIEKPNQERSFFRELAQEKGLEQEPRVYIEIQVPLGVEEISTTKRQPQQMDTENDNRDDIEESLFRNSLTPLQEEAMLSANMHPHRHKQHRPEKVYTEGGLITMNELPGIDATYNKEQRKEEARELLANMLGFTRHERLDVKKPGPMLGPPPSVKENLIRKSNGSDVNHNKEQLPAHIKGSNEASKKKKVVKNHSDEDHAPHTVDTEYAHVFVKNPIDSWNDGVRIVNELANILHMQGYFTYLTVLPHEVSFRVDSNNPEHKTAIDIARAINENRGVKNNILRRLGVTVLSAGVGDKIKRDEDGSVSAARIELADQGPDVTHIMVYMFAGAGAAAIIVIFVTLILIKRHDKKRDKLGGIQSGIAGAESCTKDYQDLCRARMAGKGSSTVEPVASGRITTLSKDNERPPSSRSSTSSWSEEPALTNMDISTGHMVLSYMEDHLRNKGRLQREWEALCRYEAEPSARDAALQPQCANLNRPGAPLPYDHSRVVLNHLANAEGLDYINASTITDHDPRAPAYVAAQGPIPSTLAHFWQMIWEQGAVVIVALCRLQENGEIACARYWPEEGAEVYHIYEVHLVSEHIWCDDYLVRSFYLKNLRTSETRTVTQFHFLSWPQGGVPPQAKALLDFRRKVNKSYRGRSCPIVVHGSGGAGRTGAYILLDLVLGRMNKGAREIDIAATLEHLRDQRAGLVATRQQFEFVLMAVAEEVHAILKALPANQSNEKKDAEISRETGVLKEEEETAITTTAAATTSTPTNKGKTTTTTTDDKDMDKEKDTKQTPAKTTTTTTTASATGKSTPKGDNKKK